MARLLAIVAAVGVTTAALAQPSEPALKPLAGALDEAQQHAASLADHAATASPAMLLQPTPDETDTFSAVVAADGALTELAHSSPGALPRGVDTAVVGELNAAHDGLAAYTRARDRGDREAMRVAAGRVEEALARADALLDRAKPLRMLHPR